MKSKMALALLTMLAFSAGCHLRKPCGPSCEPGCGPNCEADCDSCEKRCGVCGRLAGLFGCMHCKREKPFGHNRGRDYNLPPSAMLMHPGPGVDGPGPGVMMFDPPVPAIPAVAQVRFMPAGLRVYWTTAPGVFASEPLICPASMEFPQGAIYRLKLTNIPGENREEVALYPTLEVGPATPRTEAFLAHNKIPVQFTLMDFDQVLAGNFVTKVIYLPDEEYQDAVAAIEELVSTRLEPGQDPIIEADRRGTILAIVRMGNKDLELPGAGAANPVIQNVSYNPVTGAPMPGVPGGVPGMVPGGPMPEYAGPTAVPSYISGVTTPLYGMPYTGTPIGLPGPPHIPLGVPAGLQRHMIKNHTHHHIPGPTAEMDIHVKQTPGLSYPAPAHKMYIHEEVTPAPNGLPNGGRRTDGLHGGHGGYEEIHHQ
jgi:hypothetical protein